MIRYDNLNDIEKLLVIIMQKGNCILPINIFCATCPILISCDNIDSNCDHMTSNTKDAKLIYLLAENEISKYTREEVFDALL